MPKITVEGVGTFDVPAGKRLVLALEDEAKIDQLHACGGNARLVRGPAFGRGARIAAWRRNSAPLGPGAKAGNPALGWLRRGGRATGRRTGGVPGTTPAAAGAVPGWRC